MNTIIEFPTPPSIEITRRRDGLWLALAAEQIGARTMIWLGTDTTAGRVLEDLAAVIDAALEGGAA